jgi:hypothetical protein
MKPIPWWAHVLHFGIAASAILSVAGGLLPGPVGVLVALSASPVKNYLAGIAAKTGE